MRLLLFNLVTDVDDPVLGFTTRWIQALAKQVDFIHVITMRAGRIDVPSNVQVYSVGKEKSYSEPRRAIEFYRHLFRVLWEDHIDVCFSHMIPIFTVLAAPVLKAKGIPIVTWYAHPSLTWILKLAHHLSDRMVTSVATAYPYKRDKLIVVGQGIDTDFFSPDVSVPPDDPPLILCVGRLSPVKDHPTLLKAIYLLRQQWGKPFQVVILGSPITSRDKVYTQTLYAQVKEMDLESLVRFEPAVPMCALPSWYRRCTVHVNLTLTGSGDKVALEAMACGKPCLVANKGFQEILGKWATYLLFRQGDAQDLASKLGSLLSMDKKTQLQIGEELRQSIVEKHSLNQLIKTLITLFYNICSNKGKYY